MATWHTNLFYSFANNASSIVINLVSVIVLSRLLTPAETGLYTVAAGLINVAQALREFGAASYILKERDLTREKIASTLGLSLAVAALLIFMFFCSSRFLADFYKYPEIDDLIKILSFNFVFVSFASIGMAMLERQLKFQNIFWIYLLSNVGSSALTIFLVSSGWGPLGLAWGSVVGVSITALGTFVTLRGDLPVLPSLAHWRQTLRFGAYSSAAGLLEMLGERAPDLIIGRVAGIEPAGLFSRGSGAVTMVRTALVGGIYPVLAGNLSKINRVDGDVQGALLKMTSYLSGLSWPAFCALSFLMHPVIVTLFGDQWESAVPIAQILCIGACPLIVGNACATYLFAVGAVRATFLVQLFSVPALLGAVGIGAAHGLEWAAAATGVVALLTAIAYTEAARRLTGLGWRQIIASLVPSLLVCTATTAPVALLWYASGGSAGISPLALLAAAVVGPLLWLGALFLFAHPLKDQVVALARRLA